MTVFISLLAMQDKQGGLMSSIQSLRAGLPGADTFSVKPSDFLQIPGAPFAYWSTKTIRDLFSLHEPFEASDRLVRQGLSTADDFRFVRAWWEIASTSTKRTEPKPQDYSLPEKRWFPLLKGGGRSAFVSDLDLVLNYHQDGRELKSWVSSLYGNSGWSRNVVSTELYFRRGFSWALRSSRFSPSLVPDGCIFSASRYQAFTQEEDLPWIISLLNSSVVSFILRMCSENFERPKYVVGIVARLPFPFVSIASKARLSWLFFEAVKEKTKQLSCNETSHHFRLPPISALAAAGERTKIDLNRLIDEIDSIAFKEFGLSQADIRVISESISQLGEANADPDDDEEVEQLPVKPIDHVLSWAVGVAFGRFDWRLATAERDAPPEPEPFDPLPIKSPGMLPDGAKPFHAHAGVLVDDQGHPHDLARLVEEVLVRVNATVPDDVRRWLQRDFFAFHLQRYSKSRRKAPIYWPLSTTSGSYTLWIYYPCLTSETLYTAINDFIEPKLNQVGANVAALRNKGFTRNQDDEKQFETLQAFERELLELRDTLLKLAPTYKPNHDDGVQISAAPLWPLFRHKPWQKVLKDTWVKLEKGDYNWAHLAMNYWPERVREKCKNDKSLAIAHGLEGLYIEPEAQPKKARGKQKAGSDK